MTLSSPAVDVGLAVASSNKALLTTAAVDNVAVTVPLLKPAAGDLVDRADQRRDLHRTGEYRPWRPPRVTPMARLLKSPSTPAPRWLTSITDTSGPLDANTWNGVAAGS